MSCSDKDNTNPPDKPTDQRLHVLVEKVWKAKLDGGGFQSCLCDLEVVYVEPGTVWCRVPVQKQNGNKGGAAHGGFLCTIIDCAGSFSITTMGLEATDNGVSTEINISFLAPAKIGSILDIESKCLRLGKTLACTEVNIYSDNQLVATGRHSKFVALAWKKFNEQQQQ